MPGGSAPAPQRAMHGAAVTLGVGGFTGEIECVLDGLRQALPRLQPTNARVAVGAARKRILAPVVHIPAHHLAFECLVLNTGDPGQRLDGAVCYFGIAETGEPLGFGPTRPARQSRRMTP